MLTALKEDKEAIIAKREGFKKEYKDLPDGDPKKSYILGKIRKCDDDLK